MASIFQGKGLFGGGGGGGGQSLLYNLGSVYHELNGRHFANATTITLDSVEGVHPGMWFLYIVRSIPTPYVWSSSRVASVDVDNHRVTLETQLGNTLNSGFHICFDWAGGAGLDKGLNLSDVGSSFSLHYNLATLYHNGRGNYTVNGDTWGEGGWWDGPNPASYHNSLALYNNAYYWRDHINADNEGRRIVGATANGSQNSHLLTWDKATKTLRFEVDPGNSVTNHIPLMNDLIVLG